MDRARAYAVLGLSPGATPEAIKAAYYRLAKLHHPDSNAGDPDAEARFKDIGAAYTLLNDKSRPNRDTGATSASDNASSMWQRGQDEHVSVQVALETFLGGGTVRVAGTGNACRTCHGTGERTFAHPVDCPACGGTGRGTITRGILRVRTGCPACNGTGRTTRLACSDCAGTGSVRGRPDVDVRVAAGVPCGDIVRVPQRGGPGGGGAPAGDLVVTLAAASHPRFRPSSGGDLATTAWVSFADLCLGGTAEVEPLGGGTSMKVAFSSGTAAGTVIAFGGQGMFRSGRRGRGQLMVRIMPRTPGILSPEQDDLLRRWKSLEDG